MPFLPRVPTAKPWRGWRTQARGKDVITAREKRKRSGSDYVRGSYRQAAQQNKHTVYKGLALMTRNTKQMIAFCSTLSV